MVIVGRTWSDVFVDDADDVVWPGDVLVTIDATHGGSGGVTVRGDDGVIVGVGVGGLIDR